MFNYWFSEINFVVNFITAFVFKGAVFINRYLPETFLYQYFGINTVNRFTTRYPNCQLSKPERDTFLKPNQVSYHIFNNLRASIPTRVKASFRLFPFKGVDRRLKMRSNGKTTFAWLYQQDISLKHFPPISTYSE